MDDTCLGISFQEAQLVLRNIRERHRQSVNPNYSPKSGRKPENENKWFENHNYWHSSASSPYFNKKPDQHGHHHCGHSSQDRGINPGKPIETKLLFRYEPLSATSSIGKRLQLLKESQARGPQNSCIPISSARKYLSCSTSYNNQITNSSENVKQKHKDQHFSPTLVKPTTSSVETITSYLPKVKHSRVIPKKNEKVVAKKQTSIQDFSLSVSRNKDEPGGKSIEIMSEKNRELLKKAVLASSDVACSLGYEDGSTLLRPGSKKSSVKGIYFAFLKQDPQLFKTMSTTTENCRCVFLPILDLESNSVSRQWTREFLTSLMESTNNKVIYEAQNFIKTILEVLEIENCFVCYNWQCFDPKIAAWLLDPDHPPGNFDAILSGELVRGNEQENDNCTKDIYESKFLKKSNGDKRNMADQTSVDMFSLLSIMPCMLISLQSKHLWDLFFDVETKISPILAVMELFGVEVNTQLLLEYKDVLQKKVQKLEHEAFKIVGHQFQMSSTQQLRQILFDELQLDKNVQKKLARTHINKYKSTSENVLKHLQEFHPLPKVILEYRHVTKLKSAYVDGILAFLQKGTLRTQWNQTCTATGRLTSTNPNIQAIPKSHLDITGVIEQFIVGKEIEPFPIVPRQVFKSRAGWTFLSADFQSIELRLLAHFSEDTLLLQIFNESEDDVFVQLASTWLSLDPKSVQNEQRERAKRIVYSVVYGVGKERLAETLGVSSEEAKHFTNSFLATFPGLKMFIQNATSRCRSQGYVTTIFGRQRLLPDINSNQPYLRSQSERQAVNFIIQGSAADICKMGMILVVRSLNERLKSNARLLVQIHDELLVEVNDEYLEAAKEIAKSCLENTAALCAGHVNLKVNFKVSLSSGKTWAQMKA